MTANEIRAGLLYTFTGAGSEALGPSRAGIAARFGVENAVGGVNGRRLAYDWRDDQSQSAINSVMARELVEKHQDFGLIEMSTVATGSAKYLADQGVPVAGIAAEPVWAQNRNMFAFSYSQGDIDTYGRYAKDHGGSRAIVLSARIAPRFSADAAVQKEKSLQAVGMPVVMTAVDEPPTDTQIDSVVREMLDEKIDVLTGSVTTGTFARFMVAARQAGVHLKVAISGGEVPNAEMLAQYGPRLAGLTMGATYLPPQSKSPATDAYHAAMAAYSPDLPDPDQTLALIGYAVADMFIRGLKAAGPCPTRQSFIAGLRVAKNYTAAGLVPATDFERDFGRSTTCFAFIAVNSAGNSLDVVDPSYCGQRLSH
ncbi:ABC transporter substrate-binding protein [Frankia sp. AgKG'84/4]|uniref:ABC transporter substrate-binding protein n=1 Tax=Frankia sp. AgKG'84/4 TaxID=573490 RepID=UPI00200F250F|nr:ABC transporter substrate-binding protein [Frankia sp. AgKG'84/4]MCL9796270.1 ABC transporter substrate-binding protein [Frankia sp. AgKG'84/4]